MKIYKVSLNGKQYAMLEKMISPRRAGQLAGNQCINGYELFSDMLNHIYSPVSDGWSTPEIVLEESDEEISLLRFLTKQVFPEEENFFLKQMGKKLNCANDFAFLINLKFK